MGHALSALANEAMSAATGLGVQLRMEDIDRSRCRPEFEMQILQDMDWLGIEWVPPLRRQSARFPRYIDALDRLKSDGVVYPSFATRREIAVHARAERTPLDPDGAPRFAGDAAIIGAAEAKERAATGAPAAWRLDMARAVALVGRPAWCETGPAGDGRTRAHVDPALWGDVVLARKETPTSYHLSVVVDDAADGITRIVRGADLFAATAVHRVLQCLLGLQEPLYHHHGLVMGEDGRKLSKSNGALSLGAMRQAGWSADALRREARRRETPPDRIVAPSLCGAGEE
ncbi:glutamyl-Q tRNA(Asp) ligase [Stappia sp. 22II-S9-Z10]|nr:glutamyl-Q tRNA(Asp) ligase [Stappia sp. 22II-S9-Z10]